MSAILLDDNTYVVDDLDLCPTQIVHFEVVLSFHELKHLDYYYYWRSYLELH